MSIKGFEVGGVQQRYDYESLDNIPANLVQDANYVHTDNNYTNADKTKLSGIEAQANKTTIDATLTHSGQAADAKATGDAISALNAQVIASMPHDTASGSIANFPDGAAMPVIDCSVAVAPNQDLHGYDNPWPAGGGVNKLPPCVAGTYTSANVTAVVSADGTITLTGTVGASSEEIKIPLSETVTLPSEQIYLHLLNTASTNVAPSIELSTDIANTTINAACSPANRIYTIPSNRLGVTVDRIRFWMGPNSNQDCVLHPMICLDNTARSYSPYSNICPISGWTEAKVTRTGKNLLNDVNPDEKQAYITGANKLGSSPINRIVIVPIKKNTDYTWTWNRIAQEGSTQSDDTNVLLFDEYPVIGTTVGTSTGPNIGVSPGTRTFNSGSNIYAAIKVANINSSKFAETLAASQLELGSTATAYEPYQGQTYTIDLDGTRYGGTLDVTTGKLTVTHTIHNIESGGTWSKTGTYGWYRALSALGITDMKASSDSVVRTGECLSNVLPASSVSWDTARASSELRFMVSYDGYFLLCMGVANSSSSAVNTWLTNNPMQLYYPLATPIEVQLTPTEITTLLGTNNIWADAGDTTVSYYADTTLFVNKKIAAAVAALS